jgi:predicted PurR-regulated permease PerM
MSSGQIPAPPPPSSDLLSAKSILRVVLIVVATAICLYLLYVLRRPLVWLFIAAFLAIALSGPVNLLERKMPRGLAIGLVYLVLLTLPFALAAIFGPPLITQANTLAQNLPVYAHDVTEFVQSDATLRGIEQNFDITQTLEQQAQGLPARLTDAATVLGGVGVVLVNSITSIVIVLVLCAFMLASGRRWIDLALAAQRPERIAKLERVADRIGRAVGNYVGGVMLVALIAGTSSFVVLLILGVPFAGPLAVLVGLFAFIPLIGSAVSAVLVAVVTVFTDFPTATIVWVIYAILYAQIEGNILQPQIQRRALNVHPFTVLVAVLFGATLFGVLGAILAIPVAASLQIAAKEFLDYRQGELTLDHEGDPEADPLDDTQDPPDPPADPATAPIAPPPEPAA